jgi:hypothetical protein
MDLDGIHGWEVTDQVSIKPQISGAIDNLSDLLLESFLIVIIIPDYGIIL